MNKLDVIVVNVVAGTVLGLVEDQVILRQMAD